uniref:GP-PDE domain-containing protein n=1 Tax=Leptocylindrus danicus TaxID=163516 RepID=A0A7S2JW17_9STRA|mmetsp:Transcript_12599/g.18929  ORF Transcript_12599/g.18929 Transcript_12599/m.18929 type:complete len:408 (+) Transcript_12599:171-1394(+)
MRRNCCYNKVTIFIALCFSNMTIQAAAFAALSRSKSVEKLCSISTSLRSSSFAALDTLIDAGSAVTSTAVDTLCTAVKDTVKSLASTLQVIECNSVLLVETETTTPPFQASFLNNQVKVIGHRGSIYEEPENSVEGFLASAMIGCDAVELDVFLLKCGTLVVFHGDGTDESPGWLNDYCGIEGNILDYTADEVRKLRLNPDCKEFAAPKEKILSSYIPTLREVLKAVKDTPMTVKIELKGPGTALPTLMMVEELQMVNQVHFSSFCHENIKIIRDLRPERNQNGSHRYKTGCLFVEPPENFLDIALEVGASEVHLKYDTCTKERIDAIHAANMGSMAWFRGPPGMLEDTNSKYLDVGNEDEAMYQTVMRTGVEGLCVNRPNVLLSLLGRLASGVSEPSPLAPGFLLE